MSHEAVVRILLLALALGATRPNMGGCQSPARVSGTVVVESPSGPWSLRKGERVRATTFDGRRVEGRVLALRQSSFVLGQSGWLIPQRSSAEVEYDGLARIEAHRPPRHRTLAMAIGIGAGLAAGAYIGAESVHTSCSGDSSIGPCFSRGSAAFAGGIAGLGLGAAGGLLLSRSRWQVLSVTRRVEPTRVRSR